MTTQMPKFQLVGTELPTLEEVSQKSGSKREDNSKFFKPGKHEVQIEAVEYRGPAKNDENWGNLMLTLKGTGEKSTKTFLLFPFKGGEGIKYGEKKTTMVYKKLLQFLAAVGQDVSPASVAKNLPDLVNGGLVGLNVAIVVDYQRAHVKYVRQGDQTVCKIALSDKTILKDAAGEELIFSDRDSAQAHMENLGIKYDAFPSVISYEASATSNSKTANSKW